jgi:hypothetical protein
VTAPSSAGIGPALLTRFPPPRPSPPAPSSAKIDPALLAHFPLARRPIRASDRLPSGYALQAGASLLGLKFSAARRVSFGAIDAWLIPGRRGACVTAILHRDVALATCGTIGPDTLRITSPEPSAGMLIGIVSDRVRSARYVSTARAGVPVVVHSGVFAVRALVAGEIIAKTDSGDHPLAVPSAALAGQTPLAPGGTRGKLVDDANLVAPRGVGLPHGAARVVTARGQLTFVLAASGVPPNTASDRYAVWLTAGPSRHELLGFVNPGVGRNETLNASGALPQDLRSYRQMIVTREHSTRPHRPGPIVLSGRLVIR